MGIEGIPPLATTMLGSVAAVFTSTAFVPQLFKIRRQGGSELSNEMLAMCIFGMWLWLAYGVILGAGPIIAANAVSIAIVSAVYFRKRAAARTPVTDPRRLRIAIDMDEVMADALGEHIRRYNKAFGACLSLADLRGRHLANCIPASQRDAAEALLDSSFFADLEVMPGAVEVIRELAAHHDVYVVTAAMDVPCSFDAKYRWLQRHFPFISPTNIVFCGDKHVIDADYLIDDRPSHFARFKGRGLLFSAPHNAEESRYPRVDSWNDVRDYFARVAGSEPARELARGEHRRPAAA